MIEPNLPEDGVVPGNVRLDDFAVLVYSHGELCCGDHGSHDNPKRFFDKVKARTPSRTRVSTH
jgi:hypothetical protein